eukprot:4481725-Amphidinium_carterae.1
MCECAALVQDAIRETAQWYVIEKGSCRIWKKTELDGKPQASGAANAFETNTSEKEAFEAIAFVKWSGTSSTSRSCSDWHTLCC